MRNRLFWKINYLLNTNITDLFVTRMVIVNLCSIPFVSRDHFFDSPERKRTKQRKTKPSDVFGSVGVMTGERGVREHHRAVKSNILPTNLIGIKLRDQI